MDEDEDEDDDDDDSQIELTDQYNMYADAADSDLSAEGGPVDKYFEKSNFIREFDKEDSTSTQRERA